MAVTTTFDWLNDTNLTISDSAEAIYTNGSSTVTHIHGIYLYNSHSSAVVVQLYFVPDNAGAVGTAASTNQFFYRSLAANEMFSINDVTAIFGDVNDTLQAVAATANKVNIFVFGTKVVTS